MDFDSKIFVAGHRGLVGSYLAELLLEKIKLNLLDGNLKLVFVKVSKKLMSGIKHNEIFNIFK
jgi:nucleoside-diphosphate-sugar epimerase